MHSRTGLPAPSPHCRVVVKIIGSAAGRKAIPVLHIPERGQASDFDARSVAEIKVLAVDDNPRFRDALRDLIAASPGFAMAGVACSGEEAVRAVDDMAPDIVLMDVLMPGMDGAAAAQMILRSSPDVMVVLISVDDPALYPGAGALGSDVVCARKQDLCPHRLREWWETHCG